MRDGGGPGRGTEAGGHKGRRRARPGRGTAGVAARGAARGRRGDGAMVARGRREGGRGGERAGTRERSPIVWARRSPQSTWQRGRPVRRRR